MNIKIYLALLFLAFNLSCLAEDNFYTKFDFNPNITFIDHNNEIQLRLNKTAKYLDSNNRQDRYFSYILKISDQIQNNCAIYLRFLDSEGFQIQDTVFISDICSGFSGLLKGDFVVSLLENEKICGAELLYFSRGSKESQQQQPVVSTSIIQFLYQ